MTTRTEMPKAKALVLAGGLLLVVLLGVAIFSGGGSSYEERRDDAEVACIGYAGDQAEYADCIDYEMGR